MRKIVLLFTLILGTLITLQPLLAQDIPTDDHRAKMTEMRKEVRDYRKAKIQPVLLELRKDFEKELSADEKERLAALRAERRVHKREKPHRYDENVDRKRAPRQEYRNGIHKPRGKRRHAGARAKTPEHVAALDGIISNHKIALDKVSATLAEEKDSWDADIKAIREKYISEEDRKKIFQDRMTDQGMSADEIATLEKARAIKKKYAKEKRDQNELHKFLMMNPDKPRDIGNPRKKM